jgi:hypothetical protein
MQIKTLSQLGFFGYKHRNQLVSLERKRISWNNMRSHGFKGKAKKYTQESWELGSRDPNDKN